MQLVKFVDLSAGEKQMPAGIDAGSLATIAGGSDLDQVEVDGYLLGLGGVVPVGSASKVVAKLRSRLSDEDGVYAPIQDADGNVSQVHDRAELAIWGPGEVPMPMARRPAKVVHVTVPVGTVAAAPADFDGPGEGTRVIRTGCAGRARAVLWLGQPALNPDATVKVLIRTRRAGEWEASNGGPGACPNMMHEQVFTPTMTVSAISSSGVMVPIVYDCTGAVDIEVYLTGQVSADDAFWHVSLELEDPT